MHTKDKGSLGEAKFLAAAAERGFNVLVPWGDNRPYDLAIEMGGKFFRVQIKSCFTKQWGRGNNYRYCCNVKQNSHAKVRYTSKTVDFVVVYIDPEDTWYIIPARVLDTFPGSTLQFYPHARRASTALSEPYHNAWKLLFPPDTKDQSTSETKPRTE